MRVTNSMMTNRMMLNVNRSMTNLDKLYTQYASGKRINRPSDDPILASRALKFRTNVTETKQYQRNTDQAMSWMNVTESAFNNTYNILKKIRDVCVDGSSDVPLTSTDRQELIAEIEQLMKQIGSEMNVTYSGRYVFSGYRTDQPYTLTADQPSASYSIFQTFSASDIQYTKSYRKLDETGVPDVKDVAILKLPYTDMGSVTIPGYTVNTVSYYSKTSDPYSPADGTINYIPETGELVLAGDVAKNFPSSGASASATLELTMPTAPDINDYTFDTTVSTDFQDDWAKYTELLAAYKGQLAAYKLASDKYEDTYKAAYDKYNEAMQDYQVAYDYWEKLSKDYQTNLAAFKQYEIDKYEYDNNLLPAYNEHLDAVDKYVNVLLPAYNDYLDALAAYEANPVGDPPTPVEEPIEPEHVTPPVDPAVVTEPSVFDAGQPTKPIEPDYCPPGPPALPFAPNPESAVAGYDSTYANSYKTYLSTTYSNYLLQSAWYYDANAGLYTKDYLDGYSDYLGEYKDAIRDVSLGFEIAANVPKANDTAKYDPWPSGFTPPNPIDDPAPSTAYIQSVPSEFTTDYNTYLKALEAFQQNVDTYDTLRDQYASFVKTNGNAFAVQYTKNGLEKGDLNPLAVFNCRDLNDNNKIYTMDDQKLEYIVGVNTTVQVNSLGKDVYTEHLYADLMNFCDFVSSISFSNEDQLIQKYSAPPYEYTGDKLTQAVKDQQTLEEQKARSALQDRFSDMLALLDRHTNKVSTEQSNLGARMNRVELISERLQEDETSYEELLSKTEDADVVEVIMNLQIASSVYQAALQAGAKIIQMSLADYVR